MTFGISDSAREFDFGKPLRTAPGRAVVAERGKGENGKGKAQVEKHKKTSHRLPPDSKECNSGADL